MIQVLLCSTDESLVARLREAIGSAFLRVTPLHIPQDGRQLLGLLPGGASPDIAVIDVAGDGDAAVRLAADLNRTTPIQVVLVGSGAGDVAIDALRAGVRDILPATAGPAEIRAALDRAAEHLPRLAAPPTALDAATGADTAQGRVITVTSPKGGVGKTTIATNLAVGLVARMPQQVVIVDADVHFGDVATALNLTPQHTLPDITQGPAAGDSIAIKSFLTEHGSGLYVIPGSESPTAADTVKPADLGRLIDLLRGMFAFVVVDTAPGLTDHTLSVLDQTDDLILATSLDVPGVRGLRKEIDTLTDLAMEFDHRHIVLNFHHKSRGLSVDDVEATIRAHVDVVLPVSSEVPLSTNQGIPLVQSGGRNPATRGLSTLVDLVLPPAPAPRRGLRRKDRA